MIEAMIRELESGYICEPDPCKSRVAGACRCADIAAAIKEQSSKLGEAEKEAFHWHAEFTRIEGRLDAIRSAYARKDTAALLNLLWPEPASVVESRFGGGPGLDAQEDPEGEYVDYVAYKAIVDKLHTAEGEADKWKQRAGYIAEDLEKALGRLGTLREDLRKIILYDSSSTQGLFAREAADKLDADVETRGQTDEKGRPMTYWGGDVEKPAQNCEHTGDHVVRDGRTYCALCNEWTGFP